MKTLWVAAVSACLIALAGASFAQAAEFKSGSYPASVSVGQGGEKAPPPPVGTGGGGGGGGGESAPLVIGFEGSLMTSCKKSTFAGSLSGSSTSLTLNATLSECAAFGFAAATLNTNGCQWVFDAGTGASDEFTGTMGFSCPAGKAMTVSGGNCEIQIGSQTGLSPVKYANLTTASPKALTIGFEVKGLTYTKSKDGFACPLNGTGVSTNGVIVGGATMSSSSGIWIE